MIGERFYGSNASTFIGVAAVVLGSVSTIASVVTAGGLQILSVGGNAVAGVMVSVAAVIIGGALVASREAIGGVTSLLLAGTLVFGGMVSISMGNFFRVLSATSDAISSIEINIEQKTDSSTPAAQYHKERDLTAQEQRECDLALKSWTRTPAGIRNCTGKGVYSK